MALVCILLGCFTIFLLDPYYEPHYDTCIIHWASTRRQTKNSHFILIMCPPPRKSLVKGERFIRSEGRPE